MAATATTAPAAASEARPGYKLTKLGWIPQEWEIVRVNDVAQMRTGHTPSTKKPSYYGGEIRWVSLQDTRKLDNFFIKETTIQITEEGLQNCSAVLLPENTVILLRTGNVGKVAILNTEMAVSQDYVTWTCGQNLLADFLYFSLQSQKSILERQANGSTVKTIGLPFF